MLDIEKNTFLNESQIREQAKSIFTTKGAPGNSEKYAHISTFQIIQDMEKLTISQRSVIRLSNN